MIKKFFNKKLLAGVLGIFVFMLMALPMISLANSHGTTTFTTGPAGGTLTPPVGTGNPGGTLTPPAGSSNIKVTNPISVDNLNGFIKIILEGIIKIGIPIIAIALVYSGFLFVEAMGDPGKLKKAKDAFVYCFIGAAILLGSWALAQMISDTVLQIK
ncbi:MAG: hypothetical protein KGZ39_08695 [Simkania sp.]|nr:hypothetical protein [Simkania sp.]MBS3905386.1 hypothetical protein [Simkania sp.]